MALGMDLVHLYDAFYNNSEIKEDPVPPVFCAWKKVGIEISLSSEGVFKESKLLEIDEQMKMIPTTEAFRPRTSGSSPFPLVDKLIYMAPNLNEYGLKKSDKHHADYLRQLSDWCEYSHNERLKTIYKYVSQGTVLDDLIRDKRLLQGEDGKLTVNTADKNLKKSLKEPEQIFVSFVIYDEETDLDMDLNLMESWKDFVLNGMPSSMEQDLSYISGKRQPVTSSNPTVSGNAKLISGNDKNNFSYRGRFEDSRQALVIGMEDSAKFHNVLSWLIDNHSIRIGEYILVVWSDQVQTAAAAYSIEKDLLLSNGEQFTGAEIEWDEDQENEIRSKLWGHMASEINQGDIYLLVLNKATPGRVSIAEYKTYNPSYFLSMLTNWYKSAAWKYDNFYKKEHRSYTGIPGIKILIELIFGKEINDKISITGNGNYEASLIDRLLRVVLNGEKLPEDFVKQAVNQASQPQSYSKYYNWWNVVRAACSMSRKKYMDALTNDTGKSTTEDESEKVRKEMLGLNLDRKSQNRSYLYGRLLAVANHVERQAYREKNGENKEIPMTNALRFMTAFAQRPYKTWQTIDQKMTPYLSQLPYMTRVVVDKEIQEIMNLFTVESFSDPRPLEGLYLLGFYQQNADFFKKKDKDSEKKD